MNRFFCCLPERSCGYSVSRVFLNGMVGAVLLFLASFGSTSAIAIPETAPEQGVLDEAGTLTKSSVSYIERSLSGIKKSKQIEVFFVSIKSLPYGLDPQTYAKDLFEKWNLSENDVIVVLVNKLAKVGIYRGDKILSLTDETIQLVSDQVYEPKAKNEQYSSAALDVNNKLTSVLLGKEGPGVFSSVSDSSSNFKTAKKTEEARSKYVAIIALLLVIAFVVPMIQFFYYVKDE